MIKIWVMIVAFLFSLINPSAKAEIKPEQPDIEKAVMFFNGYNTVDEGIDIPIHRLSLFQYATTEKGYRHFTAVCR